VFDRKCLKDNERVKRIVYQMTTKKINKTGIKIAVIAPPWISVPPPRYGGIELVVYNLVEGLTALGHEVLLFAPLISGFLVLFSLQNESPEK